MKYKIGDRIRNIDTGWIGDVIGTSYGKPWNLLVAYDDNDEIEGDNEYYVREEDIEFVDKKQAFLERLQELLSYFDASITGGGYDGYGDYLQVQIGSDEPFGIGEYDKYDTSPTITADNILNDYKE